MNRSFSALVSARVEIYSDERVREFDAADRMPTRPAVRTRKASKRR
jgi:hypothetical protein